MPQDAKIGGVRFPRLLPAAALASVLCLCASLPASALWGAKGKAAAQAGAILFRDRGCVRCHGVNLEGAKKGPALADLRKQKQWTPAKITDQIMNGGQKMPPFGEALSQQETAQLVAYLRAKHRPAATAPPQ